MKRLTLILSAVIVAFSLSAQPLSRLITAPKAELGKATKEFKQIGEPANLPAATIDFAAIQNIRKAPKADFLGYYSEQTGYGAATCMWAASIDSVETWATTRFMMQLYALVNDSTLSSSLASLNAPAAYLGDTTKGIFSFGTANLIYNGGGNGDAEAQAEYLVNDYYLVPGDYVMYVRPNNGSAFTGNGMFIPFTIISYDVTGYKLEFNADSTQAIISWDELELPEDYYYGVDISCGATTVYSNLATLTTAAPDTAHSPVTVSIEKNKTYTVNIMVYEIYNGRRFLGCDEGINETFCVGEDPNVVSNIQVIVSDSLMQAMITWECGTAYSMIELIDINGNNYGFVDAYQLETSSTYYTNKKSAITEPLPVGIYAAFVVAAEVSGGYIYEYGAQEMSPIFQIKDVLAPEITKVSIDSLAADAAHLIITAEDNSDDPEDLIFAIAGDITVADTVLADGSILLAGLTENQKYSITITAKDAAGNVSEPYALTFVPTDDQEAPTNFQASVKTVADKFVVLNVSAQDNKAAADELVYMIAINGGEAEEFHAVADSIVLEGLTPKTEYSLALKVRDLAGNVADTTITLTFTTTDLIPINIVVKYAEANQRYYATYGVWEVYLYDMPAQGVFAPMAYFAPKTPKPNMLSGTYSISGKSMLLASITPAAGAEAIDASDAVLKFELITFVPDTAADGSVTIYGAYNIQFQILGKDGNLYQGQVAAFVDTYYYVQNVANSTVSMTDEDAFPTPQLTGASVVEGSLTDTSATIHLDVTDLITDITDLKVFITTDKIGTPFDEKSDINNGEGYRLDADGNFTLEGLEPEKKYTLRFEVVNDFGKSCYADAMADRVSVTFTTLQTGLEDLRMGEQAVKVFENGQIYILRGDKKYTVLGAEVVK